MKVLEFLFKLRDQFRTPAQRVINTIRSLTQVEQAATRGLAKFGRMLSSLRIPAQVAANGLRTLRAALGAVAIGAAGLTAVGIGAGFGIKSIIDSAAYKQEQLIGFTTLLGDGASALNVFQNAVAFADSTPFETPDILNATKQMLGFGFTTAQIPRLLTSAGDATSSLSKGVEGLGTIIDVFGKMKAQGKVSLDQINMLSDMGIGGLEILAKGYGMTGGAMAKAISAGAIKGTDAIEILSASFQETFGGGMANQSKSINGLFSTLKSRSFGLFSSLMQMEKNGKVIGPLRSFQDLLNNLSDLTDFNKAPGAGIKAQFKESIGGLMGIVFGAGNNLTGGNKGKQLVEGVVGSWRKINLWFRANGGKIGSALRTVGTAISKAVGTAANWLVANGPKLWQTAQHVFKEFVAAVQIALIWLRAEGPKIWQAAKQIFAGIMTAIQIALPIIAALAPFTPQIIGFFLAFKGAQAAIGAVTVIQKFVGVMAGLPNRIMDAAHGLDNFVGGVRRTATALKAALLRAYAFTAALVRTGVAATVNAARGIGLFIVQVARMGAQLLVTAASSIVTFVGGLLRMGATALLTGARMAAAWLIGLGPVGWIIAAVVAIGGAFVLLYNKVSWFRAFVDASWQFIKNGAMALWAYFGTLPAAFAQVWLTIQGAFNNTIAWFQGLPERFVQFGANIVQGIIDGITSKIAAVRDTILGVASSIGDWFSGSGGIDARSPSRVFTVKGSFISSGIEQGILGGRKQVAAAIKTLAAGAAITASVALQPTAAALSMPMVQKPIPQIGVQKPMVQKPIPQIGVQKPMVQKPIPQIGVQKPMVQKPIPQIGVQKPLVQKVFTPKPPKAVQPIAPVLARPSKPKPLIPKAVQPPQNFKPVVKNVVTRVNTPKPLVQPSKPELPKQILSPITIPSPVFSTQEVPSVVQPRDNPKQTSSNTATIKLEVKVSGDGSVSDAGKTQIAEVSVEQLRAALEQMGYEIGG